MTLYFVLTHRHGNRLDSICIQIKATEIHTKDESKHCVNEMTVATRSHPFHLFSFFFRFFFRLFVDQLSLSHKRSCQIAVS